MALPSPKFDPVSGVVATESDLLFLKDYVAGDTIPTLAVAMGIDDPFFDVVPGTEAQLPLHNFVITIGTERMFIGQNCRSGVRCSPVVREYGGTTKAAHPVGARVNVYHTAAHHNQLAAEIIAIQNNLRWNFRTYWRPDPVAESIAAWYRTDELTPDIDGNGDLIVLRDRSGNGYDATAVVRPHVSVAALNGHDVVVFDGTGKMETVPIPRLHGVDATIFLLARATVAGQQPAVTAQWDGGTQRTATIHQNWAGDFYGDVGDTTGGTNRLLASPSFSTPNAWELITIERWAGNGWVWHNGTLVVISTDMSTNVPTDSQPFRIAVNGWIGEVEEILVCTFSNDTAKRAKIEGYMMHRAALAGLLPGTHPYKSVAP